MSAPPVEILVLRRWHKSVLDKVLGSEKFKSFITPYLPKRRGGRLPTNMMLEKTRVPSTDWSVDDVRLFAGIITILHSNCAVRDTQKSWLNLVGQMSSTPMSEQDKSVHFYTCDDEDVVAHISQLLDETIPAHREEFFSLFMVAHHCLGPRQRTQPEEYKDNSLAKSASAQNLQKTGLRLD
jgi:hypothetical protein